MAACLKTFVFYGCSNATGTTCTKTAAITAYVPNSAIPDPTQCTTGLVGLSSAEYVDFLAALTSFGWDSALFEQAFAAGLLLFVIGLTIGLIISTIRKARTP